MVTSTVSSLFIFGLNIGTAIFDVITQLIAAKIEAYMPEVCVLDFQDVTFVDSSGIAVVINALRNMSQIEGKLLLSGISPQPMRVFRASGIDKLVEIREAVS